MSNAAFPSGFSEAATILEEAKRASYGHLAQSVTFSKQPVYEDLWDTWQECKEANWDGFDALPVDHETYHVAYCFVEALPLTYPLPTSVGAEPDGHLTFEWHRQPHWTLSASISAEGTLHYAALLGTEDPRGSSPFYGEVPESILNLIRRVCRR